MRKLCPNLDKEDGLDTVLEVPIPEEMFNSMGSNAMLRWANLRSFMKAQSHVERSSNGKSHFSSRSNNEFMALLKLVGSPLIPLQVHCDNALTRPIKDCSIVRNLTTLTISIYVHFSLLLYYGNIIEICMHAGGFYGKIYSAAICSGDWGTGGIELGE